MKPLFCLLVIYWFVVCWQVAGVTANDDFESLRRAVAENEPKYAQMDATYETGSNVSQKYVDKFDRLDSLVVSSTGTVTGLWHGPKYFAQNQRDDKMGDGKANRRIQIQAFDGSKTRLNHYGQVGNIVNEKTREYSVKPIYFGIPKLGTSTSLEGLLNFDSADQPYLSWLRKWKHVDYDYYGKETKNGLECHRVDLSIFYLSPQSDQPQERRVLWISPAHNYLVAASEVYYAHTSDTQPKSAANVLKWRKLPRSGVFVPETAENVIYEFAADGQRTDYFTRTYRLTFCKLDSQDDDTRFSDVPMPAGAEVYIVEKGKIVDTQIDGESVQKKIDRKKPPR